MGVIIAILWDLKFTLCETMIWSRSWDYTVSQFHRVKSKSHNTANIVGYGNKSYVLSSRRRGLGKKSHKKLKGNTKVGHWKLLWLQLHFCCLLLTLPKCAPARFTLSVHPSLVSKTVLFRKVDAHDEKDVYRTAHNQAPVVSISTTVRQYFWCRGAVTPPPYSPSPPCAASS